MEIQIINLECQKFDSVNLPDGIYGIEPRLDVMHFVVNGQLANRRSGCHKAKGISEISGTTRKPFAQKGGGRARQGSLRSPQFRGGAVIFGPVVRSHAFKINKKVRLLALKSALSFKAAENKLMVIDNVDIDSPSTKRLSAFVDNMGFKSVLFLSSGENDNNFKLSVGNLINIDYLHVNGLNVYDILRHEYLVINKSALEQIEGRLDVE